MAAERLVDLTCACANLRRAARAVTRSYERAMKYTGVTPTQFTLLQALDRAGPLRQGKLGDTLALDSTTLTRMLSLLVRRRLIQRRPGVDRRQIVWALTEAGQRKLVSATAAWKRAQQQLRSRLGTARWNRLAEDLTVVATVAVPPRDTREPSWPAQTTRTR